MADKDVIDSLNTISDKLEAINSTIKVVKQNQDVKQDSQKVDIQALISLIDQNESKLFKLWDFFGRSKITFFLTVAAIYVFIEPVLLYASTSVVDKSVIFLSFLAVLVSLLAAMAQYAEANIISVNYGRLEDKIKNDDEKPLLMALIKIRCKHNFKLEEIQRLNPEMFTKEKLLEKLYE